MPQSSATTQINCQIKAPTDFSVLPQQGCSSQLRKCYPNALNIPGRKCDLSKSPSHNSNRAERWRKPDCSQSQLRNLRPTIQKKKTPTLIPVLSLEKDKSSLGNKNLGKNGKCKVPHLSSYSNLAENLSKDSKSCPSLHHNSPLPYFKSSFHHNNFAYINSDDTHWSNSSVSVDLANTFAAGDGIFHEKYATSLASTSNLMQQSDSSLSPKCHDCDYPQLTPSLKVQSQIKGHLIVIPHKSQLKVPISRQYATHGNTSTGANHSFTLSSFPRSEYRSKIPKFNLISRKQYFHSSMSHESVLVTGGLNTEAVGEVSRSGVGVSRAPMGKTKTLSPSFTGKTRQIHTTQPNSFWCGRFIALHDRFHNDMLETLVIDKKTYTRFQDGTIPPLRTDSTKRDGEFAETTAGLQYLNDEETRRCKKSFIHLGALCVTDEAKKSLWQFQLAYARSQGKKQLLPSGGEMESDINEISDT